MENKYLLGVDVGTTSIKVAIIDENARMLGMSSSSYRMITPNQDYAQTQKICGGLSLNVSGFCRAEKILIYPW